jgi:hypothetical protein
MAQTFGMTTEYERLKGETDHNVLPDVGRSLPDPKAKPVKQPLLRFDEPKRKAIASELHRLENANLSEK